MKLAFPEFHEPIIIKDDVLNTLVIEKPSILYRFINDIRGQIEKMDGQTVLSENEELLSIAKTVELITDIYGMNLNDKSVQTKLIDRLNARAMSSEHYESTMKLMAEIHNYIDTLAWKEDVDLLNAELTPKQLLKAFGLMINPHSESFEEAILAYVRVTEQFLGMKLFVFVNFRSFIEQEKFLLLAETLVAHDVKALFVDNRDYPRCKNENRLTIDIDCCEF